MFLGKIKAMRGKKWWEKNDAETPTKKRAANKKQTPEKSHSLWNFGGVLTDCRMNIGVTFSLIDFGPRLFQNYRWPDSDFLGVKKLPPSLGRLWFMFAILNVTRSWKQLIPLYQRFTRLFKMHQIILLNEAFHSKKDTLESTFFPQI